MDLNKLILPIVLSASVVTSCNSPQPPEASEEAVEPTVSLDEYNQLQERYELLKEASESTKAANERARQELDDIMVKLSAISGRTIKLQRDAESGIARDTRTRAEQIAESIAVIKRRLNAVSTADVDRQTLALVENLRKTIALNEYEIKRLNSVIEEKDQKITTLDSELDRKNKELMQALAEMRTTEKTGWLNMGDELTRAADLLPDVKGHGNMREIRQAKLLILLRAKAAYKNALQLGCAEADSRIQAVEERYQRAYNK